MCKLVDTEMTKDEFKNIFHVNWQLKYMAKTV